MTGSAPPQVFSAGHLSGRDTATVRTGHVLLMFQPRVGGVPRYVANLAKGLANRGWRVTVAAPSDTSVHDELSHYARILVLDAGSAPSPRDLLLCARIAVECRRERVNLIHAHSSKAGALAVGAGVLAGAPSIYSPHVWSFQREQSRLKDRAYQSIERTLMRGHRHAIAVADVERTAAVARLVVAPERIELIETGLPDLGVPSAETARADLGCHGGAFLVGWVGRLGQQKRSEDLLPLTELLGDSARLVALGYGMPESEIGRALTNRGAVVRSDGDAANVYGACDALVITSRWEASPVVVYEAMRAGLPVVAYDVGGIGRQIEDGRTGFLVQPGDVAGLADRILALSSDPGAAATMGQLARRRFEERFGFERMIDRIVARYVDVMAASPIRS